MSGKSVRDPCFTLLGADSILASTPALGEEIEGVKEARDPERVHRMRVASRRLRAKLQTFREILPERRADRWRKEIRRLTRALGAARDRDVQLLFLADFKAGLSETIQREGISRLELRLTQQRRREQGRVLKTLDRLTSQRTLETMAQTLREIRVPARMRCAESGATAPASLDRARAAMAPRIMELLSYEIHLKDRARSNELHPMRIAAKRLRYTMEIFEPWFPELLPKTIKQMKDLQETLGDIHDCDVWAAMIPEFLEEERGRTVKYYGAARGMGRLRPGIELLKENRAAHRERKRGELLDLWPKTIHSRSWRELMKETFPIADGGPPPSGPGPAPEAPA